MGFRSMIITFGKNVEGDKHHSSLAEETDPELKFYTEVRGIKNPISICGDAQITVLVEALKRITNPKRFNIEFKRVDKS